MDSSNLYSQTLSQLNETELKMTSPEGDALIQAASPADHQKAIQVLLDVHEASLALGNANLQSIAEKLKQNEKALVAGTEAVQDALNRLEKLTEILETVSTLIEIVAKIAPMIP